MTLHASRTRFWLGILLVFLAAFCFATKGVLIKLAYQYLIDTISLLTLRMLFALPFYIAIALLAWQGSPMQLTVRQWATLFLLGYHRLLRGQFFQLSGIGLHPGQSGAYPAVYLLNVYATAERRWLWYAGTDVSSRADIRRYSAGIRGKRQRNGVKEYYTGCFPGHFEWLSLCSLFGRQRPDDCPRRIAAIHLLRDDGRDGSDGGTLCAQERIEPDELPGTGVRSGAGYGHFRDGCSHADAGGGHQAHRVGQCVHRWQHRSGFHHRLIGNRTQQGNQPGTNCRYVIGFGERVPD